MDTIFALASAPGRAGVSVFRVSGPKALEAARSLCGHLGQERVAVLRRIASEGAEIDHGLVLWFGEGRSFTGETVVEFHCHGSPAVTMALSRALTGLGLRPAEPGEFTRRALMNGKLDLTQVEGLGDLIAAETEAQLRQAQRMMRGVLAEKAEAWRGGLLRAVALVEASLDFADEDVPVDVVPDVRAEVGAIRRELLEELGGFHAAERVREGFEVAIVGPPNAGKSTLLNRLSGRDAAIVSSYAGTTRDVIEVRMNLSGLAVTFLDTAGLREARDPVEAMGIARGVARANSADLRVFLLEPAASSGPEFGDVQYHSDDIRVMGKADLLSDDAEAVSGLTGQGVSELLARISAVLSRRVAEAGTISHIRHRRSVEAAVESLGQAEAALAKDAIVLELVAEELRAAIGALEQLVGRIGVEAVLGEVFAKFCIGK
ncbi:MAG: tRNA uridine-5-carboxymethylaminomethyl(34) synthesis GTPase MnmE [Gemmobacter sp.]